MKEIKLCECGCGGIPNKITHTVNKNGLIKGEYNRFIKYHHFKNLKKSLSQRKKCRKLEKNGI